MKLLIKPASQEYANEHWYDNDPPKHPNLGEAVGNGRVAVALPAPVSFRTSLDAPEQRIFFRLRHAKSAELPGRR